MLWLIFAFQVCWVPPTQNVDGTELTDLAGYILYYGTSSRNYPREVPIAHDPNAVRYCYNVRAAPGTYHVAMIAIDGEGNRSAYSNEVIKIEGRLEGPGGGRLLGPSGGRVITETQEPDGSTTITITEGIEDGT